MSGVLPDSGLGFEWALLGVRLYAPDPVTHVFLVFTLLIWVCSGIFARTYLAQDARRAGFWGFFLVSIGGNIGLVFAQDVAGFYLFYAVMTFAAYGLILHERSQAALHAGRVYLVMALAGEALLLAAFFLLSGASINLSLPDVPRAVAASPYRDLIVGLLLAGFGIKAGAVPLHLWLPPAYTLAPAPASAALSGAMTKAGILGCLRFLPLGVVSLPAAGLLCASAGLLAVFYGALVGVTQRDPKTVLAYSSISQMGFMILALGVGLAAPEVAEPATVAILFFALHHALAKAALFFGTAVAGATGAGGWPRRLVRLGLVWPALEIAGAPLSSGALAKISLKSAVELAPWGSQTLIGLLSLAAIGSTLLMARFLYVAMPARGAGGSPGRGLWLPWAGLLVVDTALLLQPPLLGATLPLLVRPDELWSAAWPVIVGGAMALAAWHTQRRAALAFPTMPSGDVLGLVERIYALMAERFAVARVWAGVSRQGVRSSFRGSFRSGRLADRVLRSVEGVELSLARFWMVGALLAFMLLVLLISLVPAGPG